MASKLLGGSCSPAPPSPPPPPLPPPPIVQVAQIIQHEMPTSSSSIHHHDVEMETPILPATSHSPGASTTTSTPSSTSSAVGAGSSGSATTAATAATTAGTTTTATRNKRQELSFAERIQVIQARTSGKSMRQLALQFGCGKTQILNILGQRDAYLKEWEDKQAESNPHISARKRRSRRTGNEETNLKVWDWYNRQKNMGIRVTGPMLQREARSIARTLNISGFAASNGWLDSFRRLHNIKLKMVGWARMFLTSRPTIPSNRTVCLPNVLSIVTVRFIRPQSKLVPERRGLNPSTSPAATGDGGGPSQTPELRTGFVSVLAVPSSSTEFQESSFIQYPTSSRDVLSPTSSVSSQQPPPPPPPLEPLSCPSHSASYYHHQSRLRREQEEEDEEDEEEAIQSGDEAEFRPPRRFQPVHPQRNRGALHHPETELGRSFAVMASFHESPNSPRGPSPRRTSGSHSPYYPAQPFSPMDRPEFHRHRGEYSDERPYRHSSSSSNSLVFSPTEAYSPSRHSTSNQQQSSGGRRNSGSHSMGSPIDGRGNTGSINLNSPLFPHVSTNLYSKDHTPTPAFQSAEYSRSIIQDGRVRGNNGGANANVVLQNQRRTSVLTSTHAVTAAAAAAAAANLENQQLQQHTQHHIHHHQQQPFTTDERTRSSSAPGLEPLPPGLFAALLSMVRSCGLSCLEYADERGDLWLEIKPPSFATYRVPTFGYRTHLMRLLVDCHLSYWLEVLGQCIRSGNFRSLTTGGIDHSVAKPILDSLNGGATICHGRGTVLKSIVDFNPAEALEQGLADQSYFTLPDYRYRAYDCTRLIEATTGAIQCYACSQPYYSPRSESPPNGIHTQSVIRLQQHSRDGNFQLPPTAYQQEEQHSHQQQQHQQQNVLGNEPLNLTVQHPVMGNNIRHSPERNTPGFHSLSPNEFLNRNNTFSGTRLVFPSARHSPQLQLAVQQTSPQTSFLQPHYHYHHHHYNKGDTPGANDQNPDDYRLARDAALLSITNERPISRDSRQCPNWEHIATTNRDNLFEGGTEIEMRSEDPGFSNEWIKQEVLDVSNDVVTLK